MKLFYKGLVTSKKHKAGRSRKGRICVRRRQGGCSVLYRKVNFNLPFQIKDNYQLVRLEYDPNRSSFIGLLHNYKDTKFNYIIIRKFPMRPSNQYRRINPRHHTNPIQKHEYQ